MAEQSITVTQNADITLLSFTSPCIRDVDAINETTEQLNHLILTHHPKKLIFDFSNVKFFTSQLLGVLIQIRAQITSYQGQLALCSITPQLRRVFSITNLDKIFNLQENLELAIAFLKD